jgi:hypothetical protein
MAKPFYSMDEVCQRLGKNADQVKALVREGQLREFRDAGKVFFKAEDVDKLAGGPASAAADKKGDTGEVLLESAEEEISTLSDSGTGTSVIGLEPIEEEETAPAHTPAPPSKKKGDTVITASGIGVFDDDELEIDVDPMAKTQITQPATSDEISLEGAGSGSGLLDLTREADDTSLGAELLDEIYPGEEATSETTPAPAAAAQLEAEEPEAEEQPALEAAETGEVVMPVFVAAGDPYEGIFSGLLVGAVLLMGLAATVAAGVTQGFLPGFADLLSKNFFIFLPGAAGLMILALVIGWVVGRASGPRRAT